jgi:hypothetical protein
MATEVTKVTVEQVQQLLPQRSEQEWADMRAEFISRGYVECSLCTRLVSPAFIREIPGIGNVALCPDRSGRHSARLGPTRLQALMRAYAQAQPVTQTDEPEPEPPADVKVLDLNAKREGRKPVQA